MKTNRFILIGLALTALAVVLAACGGGATTPAASEGPAGDAVKGKVAFEGTCYSCHGIDAKGLPGLGKDLTTSEFAKGKTDAELVEFLKVGRSTSDPLNTTGVDMPPKGGNPALTDEDLSNVVAYLRTLEQ